MNLGTVGVIGALAFGAAIGAIVPVPAYDSHEHSEVRPELSLPASAEFDYEPPERGSYRLPAFESAADGRVLDESGPPGSLRELFETRRSAASVPSPSPTPAS